MDIKLLEEVARNLVSQGKGILAADESAPTIKKRFDSINVEPSENNRRDYREMLFSTKGISSYISGIILFDETIRQKSESGEDFVKIIKDAGIIPGIKVDKGAKPLASTSSEMITEGLDGLRERLTEYAEIGASFTKWRAVISIGDDSPTTRCIVANAHALARYAVLSQEAGLVPIVEPEVLMNGRHDIDQCYDATRSTLRMVFSELDSQGVQLSGMLLKPNMVLSGTLSENRAGPEEVAEKTIDCFKCTVPAAVPGIVFLSGGQTDEEATVNLDALNRRASIFGTPWQLSFSYGRGLQSAALKSWAGQKANIEKAQKIFYSRALVTSAARQGSYTKGMENDSGI